MTILTRRSFLLASTAGLAGCGGCRRPAPVVDEDPPVPSGPRGGKFALLVGVTTYPRESGFRSLAGPAGDVKLLGRVLHEQFGFPVGQMVALTERTRRPTREAIRGEFRRLAGEVHKGDQVVILLSGHGSQQPQG